MGVMPLALLVKTDPSLNVLIIPQPIKLCFYVFSSLEGT